MLRKIFLPSILAILGYGFWISPDFKEISAGIAIFLFGMLALEEGFGTFSGGLLEIILNRFTDKLYKSIGFGFVATALMQSSSLVSVITISFLGSGLIGLAQGVGIIYGANIGTTTGAWLMAGFGLKIKISAYAMPMLVFGIIFIFQKSKALKGIGYILAGLGFLFLGIHYMKEGFDAFKDTVDLASFSVDGFKGVLIYIGIGIVATVIMQSSHATIVIILTALSVGQITYENAIALTIGANIGTTITAIIGSLSSNIDGKRLAAAHLIFNVATAVVAVVFLDSIISAVEAISRGLGIGATNYTLKLAVFDSLFKVMGVVLFIPLTGKLVDFLQHIVHRRETADAHSADEALYLNDSVLEFPYTTIIAVHREVKHLYDNACDVMARTLNIKPELLHSDLNMEQVLENPCCDEAIDFDETYVRRLKTVYSQIAGFVSRAQATLPSVYSEDINKLRMASLNIVEATKGVGHLQKNYYLYTRQNSNPYIRDEYRKIAKRIGKVLRRIETIANTDRDEEIMVAMAKLKITLKKNNIIANGKLDKMIRKDLITNEMATSLMNDSADTSNIIKHLIRVAELLFVELDSDIQKLGDDLKMDDKEIDTILKQGGEIHEE